MPMRTTTRWLASMVALVAAYTVAASPVRAQVVPSPEAREEWAEDEAEGEAAEVHADAVATPDGEEVSTVAEPFDIPPTEPTEPFEPRPPDAPAVEAADDPVPEEELRFWGVRNRFFVSGVVDLGVLFVRPRFQFGYGTPHELWGGLQIDPILSTSGVGLYGGLRGEIPHADLRIGGRYRYSFNNSFLMPLDAYDHLQYRDRSLAVANYLSWEAQFSFDIPIESTAILVELTATYVSLIPDDLYVFEESLRVITDPGFLWGAVLGYRIRFGDDNAFHITPQVEIVHLTGRGEFVFRAGLRAGIRLWPDFEVRLIAMPAWFSPDSLGAAGGDTFLVGVRYLWATDAPRFGS